MNDDTDPESEPRLGRYALAFGGGLLAMGWVALRLATTAYASANPEIGGTSPSMVFWLFNITLFVGGAAVSFLAAYTALFEVLRADYHY
jgi:hypothetical protein